MFGWLNKRRSCSVCGATGRHRCTDYLDGAGLQRWLQASVEPPPADRDAAAP